MLGEALLRAGDAPDCHAVRVALGEAVPAEVEARTLAALGRAAGLAPRATARAMARVHARAMLAGTCAGAPGDWARAAAANGAWRTAEAWRKELTRELRAARGERAAGIETCIRLGIEGEALLALADLEPAIARAVVAAPFPARPTRAVIEQRIRRLSGP